MPGLVARPAFSVSLTEPSASSSRVPLEKRFTDETFARRHQGIGFFPSNEHGQSCCIRVAPPVVDVRCVRERSTPLFILVPIHLWDVGDVTQLLSARARSTQLCVWNWEAEKTRFLWKSSCSFSVRLRR